LEVSNSVPAYPTAKQEVEIGQLTAMRVFVVPLEPACHVVPVRINAEPLVPTATHVELLGQLTPNKC
jgi:hypothetical protein